MTSERLTKLKKNVLIVLQYYMTQETPEMKKQ